MADLKISQLTDGGASQATDEYVVARSGSNFRIDGASVAAAATSVGTLSSLTVSGAFTGSTIAANSNSNGVVTNGSFRNADAGTDARTRVRLGNNAEENALTIDILSSTNTVGNNMARIINQTGTGVLVLGTNGTEKMRLDASGNLGLGVTPSAWSVLTPAMQLGAAGSFLTAQGSTAAVYLGTNAYFDGTNFRYVTSGASASYLSQAAGVLSFLNAPSGTAGNAISFTQAMTLDASGNLLVNKATASYSSANRGLLELNGTNEAWLVLQRNATAGTSGIVRQTSTGMELLNRENTPLILYTNDTERARITSTGAVLVNVTSVGGKLYVYNPATNFETNTIKAHDANASTTSDGVLVAIAERNTTNNTFYALGYYNTGAAAWKWRVADSGNVTNTNGSYGTISDIKHKQDVVDAPSQWDDLKAIRFRKFRMKSDVEANPDAPFMLGVVAQEVQEVSPGLVEAHPDTEQVEVMDEDGKVTTETRPTGTETLSVKSSILLMKAAVALQEAMARIEALEARLEALEA